MTWVGWGPNYMRGILEEKGLYPPLPLYLSRGRIHHHRLCHRPPFFVCDILFHCRPASSVAFIFIYYGPPSFLFLLLLLHHIHRNDEPFLRGRPGFRGVDLLFNTAFGRGEEGR
jgi:hypothetical protein